MTTIMFIDDDDQMRILGKIDLEDAGYGFVGAANGKQALLEHQKVDVILVDIFMPHMDGIELIPALRRTRPTAKIIAMLREKA